ncbi:MAG TPA: macrodomain protein [Deltaproteobacteria bacterium]|nr:macrodomain protein [Deltaproteobacteria bacterium]
MTEIVEQRQLRGTLVRVLTGDLTESDADAVVNAANSRLQHGGGVAGAIVRKGGSIIQEESNRIGYVPVGESALTTGGRLKARFVIHTVGPRWGEGDEEQKLRSALRNTLRLANEKSFSHIAMPAISAGIFGFPKERCAQIIIETLAAFISSQETTLKTIDICLMDSGMVSFFVNQLNGLSGDK